MLTGLVIGFALGAGAIIGLTALAAGADELIDLNEKNRRRKLFENIYRPKPITPAPD